MEPDSPALKEALEFADQYQLTPVLSSKVKYTEKELSALPFFGLNLPTPLELEGVQVNHYGTQYAYTCPHCRFHHTLTSDVLVDRKFVKKYKIAELEPHVYVSAEMRTLIEDNGLTGVSFPRRVLDYKGREMPEMYVMEIHHVLPPLSSSTWLERSEYSCGHDIIYLRSDLQYEKEKLEDAPDFSLTAEHLNNWRNQKIIISAKVRKLFQQNRIYSRYIPVTLL